MTITHGFELLREQTIPELNTRARLYRHQGTGTELLSLVNEDDNKVFGATFRTPAEDSTGLPHILEHSVLCGSRKYPVKEPFVELVKGSLNTFLNAFTYPDKTCYPVASTNLQDFYNLIDVYMDAVLYPRLTPQILQQEGWHYELEDPESPLIYKGVVFNEMKGNYSSPEGLLGEYVQQTLFPGHTYGVDSAGDPAHIPDLTWEQFEAFHKRFYHPSNARLFFYGDDPEEERLRLMNEYLSEFERFDPASDIPLFTRFDAPQRVERRYPVNAEEAYDKKAMIAVSWLLPEVLDFKTQLAFLLLDYILIETPASPLRKALIDSGLGEDLSMRGLNTALRQMTFSTGLKGIRLEDADRVEELILSTLRSLVEEGIDRATVEAAINSTEFSLRENNTGAYPRGLGLMLRALTPWLYDGDPFAPLAFEGPLEELKAEIAADPRYFEKLVDEHFLENTHRVTLVLKPDPALAEEWERRERARLEEARAGMDAEALRRVIDETIALKKAQETPDPPEKLALIPRLDLDDLEREHVPIPIEQLPHEQSTILFHDLFTNGITYLDVGMNLHHLPEELLPYASLFGRALLEMGTEQEDFVRLSQRIDRETGGIQAETLTTVVHDREQGEAWLFLRGKALLHQSRELLDILRDVLLGTRLDNVDRFRQILLEEKAGLEARLIPMGHQVVNRRMRAHFNEADWAAEQLSGVAQLQFLRELIDRVEQDWPTVLQTLDTLRDRLVRRGALLVNLTLDANSLPEVEPLIRGFLDQMPAGDAGYREWQRREQGGNEGLAIPAPINYVGKAANLYDLGYVLDGSAIVIGRYLRTSWLWERVRVQGGAYGGFSIFVPRSGIFSFVSYRDPNLLGTIEVYDRSGTFLRQADIDEDELTKAIIGAIGDLDSYQLPDAKGWTSLERFLAGTTDSYLQKLRDEVLSTTVEDFRAFGDVLDRMNGNALIVVMGGAENLKAASEALASPMTITRLL